MKQDVCMCNGVIRIDGSDGGYRLEVVPGGRPPRDGEIIRAQRGIRRTTRTIEHDVSDPNTQGSK